MQVIRLERVTSTQDFAEAVSEMVDGDFVVVAQEQTKARGRYGREWYSPRGGLWVTYVIKNFNVEEIGISTLKVALSIRNVLSRYVNAKIRWPNDIVINDKKVSGVLLEAITMGERGTGFIGFGVNTNVTSFPQGIVATSLKLELGHEVDNDSLLEQILDKIGGYMVRDTDRIVAELNENLSIAEREVILKGKDWEKRCTALFVDKLGRLVTECGIFEVEEVLRLETP
ncbi:putative biotin ligase [Metallosphaera sp. J1]|uniref:biotin--[acetyl-CoA-carboxylase] ligase n=1 Tax=Metallosphaera TaxID=41980 RepID=UPI001EE0BD39|nr:biotin--[acetyl-CoA-carboxylase] ligase [Metallosphaera javensis (ex Hofmann et al. 2022)]MCG3108608.1 putative biotin ligase [Metallosphaera javensis (ex Hofmann et al. 2022)]BCS91703.1 MAG: putative biotin ligase [Metallosphaera javensis (ex Sakai et al. 2022)]